MQSVHVPVLKREVVEFLRADAGGNFLDLTFGGGGHARAILEANPQNTLLAFDRDLAAVNRAQLLESEFPERFSIKHASFGSVLSEVGVRKFDGILADLGISSDQLEGGRGFSFNDAESLDMRMDQTQDLTASHIVNEMELSHLERVLKQGGAAEEARWASRAIVSSRPLKNSAELAKVIEAAFRGPRKRIHPATVIFQAIRIAVNEEMQQVVDLLEALPTLASKNGRAAIICFHSLEDRIVTQKMRAWATPEFSASMRTHTEGRSLGKLLTKKACVPTAEEVDRNPRSRSARMRVFEFLGV